MAVYLLDTDSVVFLIRGRKAAPGSARRRRSDGLLRRVRRAQRGGERVAISAITRAELEYGAAKSEDPDRERTALDLVLSPFDELGFDAGECARHYGAIRWALEGEGQPIGAMDLLIAAHARALSATLVTNNLKHFTRVPELRAVNWAQ